MKKLVLLGFLLLSFATYGVADEITFSFIIGAMDTLTASPSGLKAGPAMEVIVSDADTLQMFSLPGTWNTSTGAASSFTVVDNSLATAIYGAGGANSVNIVGTGTITGPLVQGTMNANSVFLTQLPDAQGALLGSFHVTYVNPAVLALFGLGPLFSPSGSEAATFAHDTFNMRTDTITGQVGGGTVTVSSEAVVPEPASLGLLGMGLLTAAGIARRRLSLGTHGYS